MQRKRINSKIPLLVAIAFVFSVLFILPNDYKHLIPKGGLILNICAMASVAMVYFVYFPKIIKYIEKNLLFSVPFIIALIASCLNDGNIEMAAIKIFYMFIFYFIGAFFEKYKYNFIKIAELIACLILAINSCVMVFHGQPLSYSASGGRIYFIFEGDISKLLISELLLFFVGVKMGVTKHKLLHYVIFAITLYNIMFSATGFFSALVMLVFMMFVSREKYTKNIFKLAVLYVVILLAIDILTIFDFFSPILANMFGKSVTLSGRTEIWRAAMGVIREHPVIGIGEYSPSFFVDLTGIRGATHAHNQIIQILLNSGVVGLSVYTYYAFKLRKLGSLVANNSLAAYYLVYLLTIVTMCVTGLPFNNFFMLSVLIVVNLIRDSSNVKSSNNDQSVVGGLAGT